MYEALFAHTSARSCPDLARIHTCNIPRTHSPCILVFVTLYIIEDTRLFDATFGRKLRHLFYNYHKADLKRADSVARRRAMEDAFMALKFIRNIHDMMPNKLYPQPQKEGSFSINDMLGFITLEKNGKTFDLFGGEISTDRIAAIQDTYRSMASSLSEADGIDYTDPEELELVIATLIDLDAMDSKSSVSLLAECSRSPDVRIRKAVANALASAPSMWILGNAGMGALQRLAEDHNPAVAAAALNAINELKQQWELEEGDSLRFLMSQYLQEDDTHDVSEEDE